MPSVHYKILVYHNYDIPSRWPRAENLGLKEKSNILLYIQNHGSPFNLGLFRQQA